MERPKEECLSILPEEEASQDSMQSENSNSAVEKSLFPQNPMKMSARRSILNHLDEAAPMQVTADQIFDYRWPTHGGDRFMIQEQIADFLDVKSFKRKYPDLTRRVLDGEEKEFLRRQGSVISSTLYNMGITALRVEEVLDLMAQDYPDKLMEYQKAVAEKTKKEMVAKQMEYQAIKADSKRLDELRKKAIQAAFDWNSEMNKDRKNERPCFFEEQTMLIHYPIKKRKNVETSFGNYPVAVIPGQYQNYYKKYSEDDLHFLPIGSVMDSEPFLPQRPCYSPEPIRVGEADVQAQKIFEDKPHKEKSSRRGSKSAATLTSASERSSTDAVKQELSEHCAFCCEDLKPTDRFVQCHKCNSCGHPTCMDMTDEMYSVIRSYNWMCMECKPCSICSNLDEEDKMLFCDRCDRGYHTFCVGLDDLPSGRWICPKFCRKSSETPTKTDQGSRSSTPLEQNKCTECGEAISKETVKSARRNRQRQNNLCEQCAILKRTS